MVLQSACELELSGARFVRRVSHVDYVKPGPKGVPSRTPDSECNSKVFATTLSARSTRFCFLYPVFCSCFYDKIMIQSGLIQNAHGDLVTDASYDFYGMRLATCSLDQRYADFEHQEAGV